MLRIGVLSSTGIGCCLGADSPAFKEYDKNPTFLDREKQRAVSHPRNKQSLSEIDATVNWGPVEKIVNENYPVGQSELGNKAYPPLMLLKAVLLQKWYGIKSDPELETQINVALTEKEIQRNKEISKVRYKIEQYFGITHKYQGAGKADPRNPFSGVSCGKKSFPIAFVAD